MEIQGSNFYQGNEGGINEKVFTKSSMRLNDELIQKYGNSGRALVMGYGDGHMVAYAKNKFSNLLVVEGSAALFQNLIQAYSEESRVQCFCSPFESFELSSEDRVDVILGNHVLEHVDDPVGVLQKSKDWLKETGYAIFSVPNANSLHRKIGVRMGMLKSCYELNEQDKVLGHQRVYDQEILLRDVAQAGYKVMGAGGFNLKLVSQKQMADWSPDLLQAIFEQSRECPPDICADVFVVCGK